MVSIRFSLPLSVFAACISPGVASGADEAIDISLLRDGISHWQKEHGRDRNDARNNPEEYEAIADRMVAFQNADGGWPKNVDWLAKIDAEEVRRIKGAGIHRSTLDNRTTYPQIRYLAEAFARSGTRGYLDAALRGMDYLIHEQHASGGWRGADVDAITFNDDVMTGVMDLLLEVARGNPPFEVIDEAYRAKAETSLRRAIDATLRCQIRVGGGLTGWCQQHSHETFAPVAARSYELPAICPAETTSILRFLKRLDTDDDERIETAIDSALDWLEASALRGIRIEKFEIEPVRFNNHTTNSDVRVVEDPDAKPVWGRFHDIETGKPFFCNRDGVKVNTLAEVALERRTGYAWYGSWPARLLAERR